MPHPIFRLALCQALICLSMGRSGWFWSLDLDLKDSQHLVLNVLESSTGTRTVITGVKSIDYLYHNVILISKPVLRKTYFFGSR